MKLTTNRSIAFISIALLTGGGLGAATLLSPEEVQDIQDQVVETVQEETKEVKEKVENKVEEVTDFANPENIVEEETIIYEEAIGLPEENNVITNQPVDDSAVPAFSGDPVIETPQSMVTEQEIQQNIQQQIDTQNNVQPEPVSTPEPTPAPAPVQNTPEPTPEPVVEETPVSMVSDEEIWNAKREEVKNHLEANGYFTVWNTNYEIRSSANYDEHFLCEPDSPACAYIGPTGVEIIEHQDIINRF